MRRALLGLAAGVLLAACSSEAPAAAPSAPAPTADRTTTEQEPRTTMTTSPTQAELDQQLRDAAWANDVSRARELIHQGADVNAKDDTEQSAYLIATSEGYLDLLRLTLRNGADVDAHDSYDGTGLIRAAERGHWRVVGELVRAGIELDHVNRLGWTALHEAVVLGGGDQDALDTVRVLIAAGVDLDIPAGRDGRTALESARHLGHDRIAQALMAGTTPRGW